MPNWKKVITSGSAAELLSLNAPSITGSLLGTASFSITASYALNSLTGGSTNTGSLLTTASVSLNTITFTKGDGSTFPITVDTGSGGGGSAFPYTGSAIISGSLVMTGSIKFDTAISPTMGEGVLAWNTGEGTLQLGLEGGNVDYSVGEQLYQYVYNAEATTLTKGTVVRVSGSQGGRIAVKRADWASEASSFGTLAFMAESVSAGAEGWAMTEGSLRGVDTSAFTGGQLIFLGSSGSYTATIPTAPSHSVRLGYAQKINASTGIIYIKIDNGYELEELHNVLISGSAKGDLLMYDGVDWINTKQLTGSYAVTGSLTATSFTGSLLGTASWAQNAVTASYVAAAGSDTQIQYNNGGSFAAAASFAFIQVSQSLQQGLNVTAFGNYSHAEGFSTVAFGNYSHAEGIGTIASGSGQLVIGSYNQQGDATSLFVIGNGAGTASRRDIFRVTTTDVQITGSLVIFNPVSASILLSANTGSGVVIFDTNGTSSISAEIRQAYGSVGVLAIDWESRNLFDAAGNSSIDWQSRTQYDANNSAIIDYGASSYCIYNYRPTVEELSSTAQDEFTQTSVYALSANAAGKIISVGVNVDLAVTASNPVFLDTDGVWKRIDQTTDNNTKLLGICAAGYIKGQVLTEGIITVTTSSGYSDIPFISGSSFYGMPVYLTGSTATYTTDKPTSGYVRVIGHMYYNSTTNPDNWIMKFNPSNDWYEI